MATLAAATSLNMSITGIEDYKRRNLNCLFNPEAMGVEENAKTLALIFEFGSSESFAISCSHLDPRILCKVGYVFESIFSERIQRSTAIVNSDGLRYTHPIPSPNYINKTGEIDYVAMIAYMEQVVKIAETTTEIRENIEKYNQAHPIVYDDAPVRDASESYRYGYHGESMPF